MKRFAALLVFALATLGSVAAQEKEPRTAEPKPCISIEQAPEHIGETLCVRGRVYRVSYSRAGAAFISFCAQRSNCPFTAVVFGRDVDKIGNLEMFEGRVLEVTGRIREYKDTVEIVVRTRDQFAGEALRPKMK